MDYLAHGKRLLSGQSATQSKDDAKPKGTTTALDGVVTSLVRAAIGGEALAEEDVDKYIAEMIMKEAQAKRKKFEEIGISAYTDAERTTFKPNKRFMKAVIQQTDNHNKALQRQIRDDASKRLREMRAGASSDAMADSDYISGIGDSGDKRQGKMRAWSDNFATDDAEMFAEEAIEPTDVLDRDEGRVGGDIRANKSGKEERTWQKRRKDDDHDHSSRQPSNPSKESTLISFMPPLRNSNSPAKAVRGRGGLGSLRLDKYFESDYNPRLDMDNFDESNLDVYVEALEDLATGGVSKNTSSDVVDGCNDVDVISMPKRSNTNHEDTDDGRWKHGKHSDGHKRKKESRKKHKKSKHSSARASRRKSRKQDEMKTTDDELDSEEREVRQREKLVKDMKKQVRRQSKVKIRSTSDDDSGDGDMTGKGGGRKKHGTRQDPSSSMSDTSDTDTRRRRKSTLKLKDDEDIGGFGRRRPQLSEQKARDDLPEDCPW
ncbi:hypothetical protein SeMB42_g00544 [Synchytrium endobioticum]|uniref:Uncharacterized protein n=1 Tax=Synchytrium endobioticum TaxID=286115 RepID=A0A507DSF9_9FUNG|nr:hypothetical protein SeLEV6574_g01174 [Synchytrium endobioticum]TPX53898.1 hypothetical protein SeMB42_g00544 [Synchytrium endobioticum]